MTAAAPLPYFTEDPAVPRRSGALTAVAVTGIVLAALMILAQAVNAGLTGTGPPRNVAANGVDAAFVFGRFARALFAVLMLLGCAGLLSLRPAARWLVIVTAYAWLVLFALEAVAFVYALSIPRTGQAVLRQTTGWAIAAGALASAVSGLAFPVFALVVLRRRDVTAAFALRAATPPPQVPAIVRATAAMLLALAALWTLQAAVEWLAVAEGAVAYSSGGRLFTAAARTQPSGRGPSAVLDAALLVLLNGTLVVGCALLLARSRTGAAIVFACCIVKMAMTIASWNVGPSLLTSTAAMSRRGAPGILVLIYHWTTILTLQATSLLWPALVLAIVTHRRTEDQDAAALPPPLPAPSPLLPPQRPNW